MTPCLSPRIASILEYPDLRGYFADLYARAKAKNPRLSQAAFARHLRCSASSWSNFLEGRRGLSEGKLLEIGEKLRWRSDEMAHALQLRALEDTASPTSYTESVRRTARTRAMSSRRPRQEMAKTGTEIDFLSVVMRESVQLPEFARDPLASALRLGASPDLARRTLDRLLEKGVLEIGADGKYAKSTETPSVFLARGNSRTMREYYRRCLDEVSKRIRPETISRRYLGSETIAFDREKLPEAREIIDRCLDDLTALSYECGKPTAIYHAGVQFVEMLGGESE